MKLRTILLSVVLAAMANACSAQVQTDFNGDGATDFTDFLILSGNFGKSGQTLQQGDTNGDTEVDFADFLHLSGNFSTTTKILSSESDVNFVLATTGFLNSTVYIFRKEATDGLGYSLAISGVSNSEFCFEGPLETGRGLNLVSCNNVKLIKLEATASVEYSPASTGSDSNPYGAFFGVVNVISCIGVELEDLVITNNQQYQASPATLRTQSSCALNVKSSTGVDITNAQLTGKGKSVFVAFGNSEVDIHDSEIWGYYFELNIGASDVEMYDSTLHQNNVTVPSDSHSAINATCSYTAPTGGNGESAMKQSDIKLDGVTFDMQASGCCVVSGSNNEAGFNAGFESDVTLVDPHLRLAGPPEFNAYGLVGYAKSWTSIKLTLTGGDVVTQYNNPPTADEVTSIGVGPKAVLYDFVTTQSSTPTDVPGIRKSGLGKFMHYQILRDIAGYKPTSPSAVSPFYIAIPRKGDQNVGDDENGARLVLPRKKPNPDPNGVGGLESQYWLPAGNLVSDGLDATIFDPNDPNDPVHP